jgi:deoxycytidylate deaminase
MSPATTKSLVDENTALPVVRIDAQEESYITLLREYLETNGCQVYISHHPLQSVTYHIVAGDRSFVKHIFQAPKNLVLGG